MRYLTPLATTGSGIPDDNTVSTAKLQSKAVTKAKLADAATNVQTGTTYTLVLADAAVDVVELSNASAVTLTVPPNASVAFPTGTVIELHQYGAGQVTVAAGAGVTVNSPGGKLKIAARYGSASLRKRATNEWQLEGNLTT